jgi:excinuclease UvrABC nuclease subunit
MQKLLAVEEARRVLTEGKDWSIWRWLLEKRRVRTAADAGTAALDDLEKKMRAAAKELKFEEAAQLRDQIIMLQGKQPEANAVAPKRHQTAKQAHRQKMAEDREARMNERRRPKVQKMKGKPFGMFTD